MLTEPPKHRRVCNPPIRDCYEGALRRILYHPALLPTLHQGFAAKIPDNFLNSFQAEASDIIDYIGLYLALYHVFSS